MSSGSISANTKNVISAAAKKDGHNIHINERHFIRSPAVVRSRLGLYFDLFGHHQAALYAAIADLWVVVSEGQVDRNGTAYDRQCRACHQYPWPRLTIPRPPVFVLFHVTRLFEV